MADEAGNTQTRPITANLSSLDYQPR
jgi:hypothetical protein